jgi:two-component system, NarL family, nitrate/nitrite response regulator NarL
VTASNELTYTARAGVLVVDDHPAVRAELARLLGADGDLAPVISCSSAPEAIGRARRLRPLVAVVDYRLPGRDGLALTLELKRLPEPPGVVIYSAFWGARLALAAIVAGADDIVEKGSGAERLCDACSAAAAGSRAICAVPGVALSQATAKLDAGDAQIVAMLNRGASPADVADALGIGTEWLELRRWAIVRLLLGPGEGLTPVRPAPLG